MEVAYAYSLVSDDSSVSVYTMNFKQGATKKSCFYGLEGHNMDTDLPV